ncbi:DUF6114 domain-containing protein [Streptomyces sp. ASQP_92]|uniref:DUF6114 domain-containing protein n=1 Tax=Streptomyces sp. ASQP_92 TaxID=2979116 RepID=UPI0021C09DA6|nr:DUF6114 domain-containing protein [Streptomyces sp. ASQP_92]MCT9093796.1 DUF6114 domain-containing protein [Streptomyces sp. ASQP_92]
MFLKGLLGRRPAGAALIVLASALEMAAFPLGRPAYLTLQGASGAVAIAVATALAGCATHMWFVPDRATRSGWAAVTLGALSYPLANLGGFLVGMVLAMLGGTLAVAWRTNPSHAVQQR